MSGNFLSEAERADFSSFPKSVSLTDLNYYFRLSPKDLRTAKQQRSAVNRLGFAVQLGALRYLGFIPKDLTDVPASVLSYLARQLSVDPELFAQYGRRAHTRTDHAGRVQEYLGFVEMKAEKQAQLEEWLLSRALEHDAPLVLFRELVGRLYQKKFVRPGVTILEV